MYAARSSLDRLRTENTFSAMTRTVSMEQFASRQTRQLDSPVFYAAVFYAAAFCALWKAAQRFLVAAMIRALPAADIFRFGFSAGFSGSAFPALANAQRFFC